MGTLLLIISVIAVFALAVISPHMAGKIQKRTNQKTGLLKRNAGWLRDPLSWWAQISLELARKAIVKASAWGKKTRRKL